MHGNVSTDQFKVASRWYLYDFYYSDARYHEHKIKVTVIAWLPAGTA